jgi:phosphotransferase system HPr (HPr) family protein
MIMFRRANQEIEHVTRQLTLLNPDGLRAEPAIELVNCVLLFDSTVTIQTKGKRYPAHRILEILLADLGCGDTFLLEAEGRDAARAVDRIGRLRMFLRTERSATSKVILPAAGGA